MIFSLRHFTPVIIWLLLILFSAILPGNEIPETGFKGFDKIVHISIYAVLCFLLKIALHKQFVYSYRSYRVKYYAVTIAFLYGFLMELIQHLFTSNRSFELLDILANTVGCMVGVLIFAFVYRKI
ncbi:MAG: VanZ family protein [Chitinophagales bacterium]